MSELSAKGNIGIFIFYKIKKINTSNNEKSV